MFKILYVFTEARQHGVGYYGFSKDDDERAKQQEALRKLRLETEQQQKKAQDLKALREKQMALRMKAARNRRRARLGLPPEEDGKIILFVQATILYSVHLNIYFRTNHRIQPGIKRRS